MFGDTVYCSTVFYIRGYCVHINYKGSQGQTERAVVL